MILDEPTNDLDTATLGALESMLVDFGVTALVVTHDRWFLDRVATSVLAFEEGGHATRYPGNYETYRRLKAQRESAPKPSSPPPAPTAAAAAAARTERPKQKKGLSTVEQRELKGLPDAIEKAEQHASELSATLANPSTYAGGRKEIAKVTAELELAKAEVERLTKRWEEPELKQEHDSLRDTRRAERGALRADPSRGNRGVLEFYRRTCRGARSVLELGSAIWPSALGFSRLAAAGRRTGARSAIPGARQAKSLRR